jgi:uncharacterized protein YaiL (DUF2058 family)
MQNLRDKLLKAGLVTPAQAQKAAEAPKREGSAPRARSAQRTPPAPLSEEDRQRAEAFALLEAEKSAERQKEQLKAAEARAQSDRARTLKALIIEYAIQEPMGEVAFHYQKRSGKIGRLLVTPELQQRLERGEVGLIEDPGKPEPALVAAEAARRAKLLDPKTVFFWTGE